MESTKEVTAELPQEVLPAQEQADKKHAKKHNDKLENFKSHFFDTKGNGHLSGYELFFIFMICALLGAIVEMIFCRVTNGYWENRSALVYGPMGLAYSIGGVVLSLLVFKDTEKPRWKIFLKSLVWMSLAEYVMSLGMEIVFHHRAWDYSNMPLNINGRICLLYSCFWGILGLAWTKLVYPGFKKLIAYIPKKVGKVFFWIMFVFFVYNCIVSAEASLRFNARTDGKPAANYLEVMLDKQFPDWYMKRVYANSMAVDANGKLSDETLSGEASHNPIVTMPNQKNNKTNAEESK